MRPPRPRPFGWIVVAVVALTVTACGGNRGATPTPTASPAPTVTAAGPLVPNTEVLDRWLDTSFGATTYCVRLRRPGGEERDHCGEGDHVRVCYKATEVGKQAPVGCVA